MPPSAGFMAGRTGGCPIRWRPRRGGQRDGASGGDDVVVLHGAPADADGAEDLAVCGAEEEAAWEGDESAVGDLGVEERTAGLGEFAGRPLGHVEEARSARLLNGDVDTSQPCAVHPREGLQVSADVHDCDVHCGAGLPGRLSGCAEDGFGLGLGEVGHRFLLFDGLGRASSPQVVLPRDRRDFRVMEEAGWPPPCREGQPASGIAAGPYRD